MTESLLLFMLFSFPLCAYLLIRHNDWIVVFGIIYPFVSLPLVTLMQDRISLLNIGIQIAVIMANLVWLVKKRVTFPFFLPLILTSIIFLICFISTDSQVGGSILLLSAKFFFFPILASVILAGDKKSLENLFRILVIVIFASNIVSMIQHFIGARELLRFGLTYGTHIIQFSDATLRPSGLFQTNFNYGFVAALLALVCIQSLIGILHINMSQKWLISGALVGIFGVIASFSRNAWIFFFIASFYSLFLIIQKQSSSSLMLLILFAVITLVGVAFVNSPVLSYVSISARFELWESLLVNKDTNILYGVGLGLIGAISRSKFNQGVSPFPVDNYFVSLLLTGGLVALLSFCLLLAVYFKWTNIGGKSILCGFIVMSLFTESWEYSEFMALVLAVLLSNPRMAEKSIRKN